MPSRCDHPLCGFHASFLIEGNGGLRPLSSITHSAHTRGSAREKHPPDSIPSGRDGPRLFKTVFEMFTI